MYIRKREDVRNIRERERERERDWLLVRSVMATSFTSRAHNVNSVFLKPALRKSIHKKSASHDRVRDAVKVEADQEVRNRSGGVASGESEGVTWVPHERTGIYYPKGQEKIMQDVPPGAATYPEEVNWFS